MTRTARQQEPKEFHYSANRQVIENPTHTSVKTLAATEANYE